MRDEVRAWLDKLSNIMETKALMIPFFVYMVTYEGNLVNILEKHSAKNQESELENLGRESIS